MIKSLSSRLVSVTVTSIVIVRERGRVPIILNASSHTSLYITFQQDAPAANTKRKCITTLSPRL